MESSTINGEAADGQPITGARGPDATKVSLILTPLVESRSMIRATPSSTSILRVVPRDRKITEHDIVVARTPEGQRPLESEPGGSLQASS